MNNITYTMTYYGQIDRLQYQLDFFSNVDELYKPYITLQVINDGYNDSELFNSIVTQYQDAINIRAYEATADVGFNNHGCRNLMMLKSKTHWNMLMDIDVYLNHPIVQSMATTELNENNMYVFAVKFDHPDDPGDYDHVDPKKILKWVAHPNTWLISKPCFWSGGGYDIEFTGMRHGDAEFFLALDREKYDHVVWHPDLKEKHKVHVRKPNRNRSYLNQSTEHVKSLNRTVDFVRERNEDSIRKHKKRLICFPWRRII